VAHLEIDEAPDERPMTLGRRNVAEPRPGKDFCADMFPLFLCNSGCLPMGARLSPQVALENPKQ